MFQLNIPKDIKARRCQKAEHTFAGTPCGIMDQFISSLGQENNLLLIDCRNNEYQLAPYVQSSDEEAPVILITNSNVHHNLSSSEYPTRVKQCHEAVEHLQTKYPDIQSLRDATEEMLESIKDTLSPIIYNRALHVISENTRTLATIKALTNKQYELVGQYMYESHESLSQLYEVSCIEIDFLVKLTKHLPGVYGSRITGGGFGGCTISLVKKEAIESVKQFLSENYFKQFHTVCEFFEALPSGGANSFEL